MPCHFLARITALVVASAPRWRLLWEFLIAWACWFVRFEWRLFDLLRTWFAVPVWLKLARLVSLVLHAVYWYERIAQLTYCWSCTVVAAFRLSTWRFATTFAWGKVFPLFWRLALISVGFGPCKLPVVSCPLGLFASSRVLCWPFAHAVGRSGAVWSWPD